jgi:hypothetical protein
MDLAHPETVGDLARYLFEGAYQAPHTKGVHPSSQVAPLPVAGSLRATAAPPAGVLRAMPRPSRVVPADPAPPLAMPRIAAISPPVVPGPPPAPVLSFRQARSDAIPFRQPTVDSRAS